ncbi:bifunctional folylpolyglutamate synthase/dihydrofolate synthase [Bifidobacterium leontopitheci]|uniref:tetrahydrofolate synthase n=1 Tax=Bifidobacterium leontopitheci TaxID=2650774 RepID=A0A6I1GKP1_9BIFI|nr:folylpolyglutamate synthase/dihydrofolate synthase family protein [Bifidobacterium leontopitheci]KAB7791342.1 dihydrofolate synthase [Bifidobacterium leontopitheci]
MSFEHPNRNNESILDVERDIMRRPPEHNTTNMDLDRMTLMLDILGHPEQSFRVIHVTGTNGKGSTARMAEAICRAYGLRTGLYTSPHLERINERIAIDGQELSDDDFVDIWDQVKDLVDLVDAKMTEQGKPRMSFFEVLTAMAIWKFADAPVDVAIVEVGMGGLQDATNVLDADAAIIGPVDMDHMMWLGDTVEQIAEQKAGIIKPGCTAVIGRQPHEEEVMPILMAAAERNHATVVRDGYEMEVTDRIPAVGGQVATLHTPKGTYTQVPIAKMGEHQAHNALAALTAAEVVIPVNGPLDGDLVAEALQGVKVPGRIEQIRTSPTIILDGGHNVNAAEALRHAIEESYDFTQLVGVISMMGDKQVEEYLGVLEPILNTVVVTENSWKARVMPAEELEKVAVNVFGRDRVVRKDSLPDAIQAAVDMVDTEDETGVGYGRGVLICGSFVTAGDARTLLKEQMNQDLAKPKAERVEPDLGGGAAQDGAAQGGQESGAADDGMDDADRDFATDANPDFNANDFGDFGFDKALEAAKEDTAEDAEESKESEK